LLQSFTLAIERGDFAGIHALLAEEASLYGDGGGKVSSFPEPMRGGKRIAQLFYASSLRFQSEVRFRLVELNDQWALLRYLDGQLESAMSFETDGNRIVRMLIQRNPDKLSFIAKAHGTPPERFAASHA